MNENLKNLKYRIFSDHAEITGLNTVDEEVQLTIPREIEGHKVTSIGENAFRMQSLKSVTIPNSVESIGVRAFKTCTSLTSITIPDSVKSIGYGAFTWCESLKSVTIPNSVTSIGVSAFEDCTSLKSVTIPNSVTSIEDWTFNKCKNLISVTIPNSIESIGKCAFKTCTSLKSVTIPSSVKSIGESAFSFCKNLISVTIPSSVTSIGSWAFDQCENLTIICNKGSYAEQWAKENKCPVKYLSETTRAKTETVKEIKTDEIIDIESFRNNEPMRKIPEDLEKTLLPNAYKNGSDKIREQLRDLASKVKKYIEKDALVADLNARIRDLEDEIQHIEEHEMSGIAEEYNVLANKIKTDVEKPMKKSKPVERD